MLDQTTNTTPPGPYETKIEAGLRRDRQALAHPFKVERACKHRNRIAEQNNPTPATGHFYCPDCGTLFQI